ncbi:IS1634 family transposase [Micromonospora sp. S4605]|jgi:transposase|uniref:IS1634 family transposase n=1 Tax=Micromonospora TaxID=1873 RepID=UPI000D6F8CCA|nr:IS1634 family transposase [Micromonospora sp. S4605]PWU49672.1 IS1634 family transposase [Micromonospora sp. S4605]
MYLRFTSRTNADGRVVRYVALAHNRRVDGRTKPDVLMNLGRVDRLDVEGLRRLAASINKHFGDVDVLGDAAEAGLAAGTAPLEVIDARPIGATWLLDGLWRRLDVAAAVRAATDGRRFTTNMERVLFALVANRAVAPMSKLSAAEWVREDALISGLPAMDEDHAYRAMDLLIDADTAGRVQEAVFFAVANLLNLEVDLLFFDTTSTYFERDGEDDGDDAFRRFGHSKDHRGDLPQIVIGLAVTKEGIPVRVWCWPGNTNDQQVLAEVKDDMRDWRLGRVITVVDRGFSSADNLAYLRRAGGHYIAGMRMRDGNPLVDQVLSRQGRYQQVRDNLRVKEVTVQGQDARFVICHNPEQAERDKQLRDDAIARINAELARIAEQRRRDATRPPGDKTRKRNEAAHLRAECALRDHPSLGRWLIQQPNGRLKVNNAKVKTESRLDGKYLIATSDPHISTEDVALGYKNLLEAERGFRDLKSDLLLRPVFHRLEHRIRAHVLICWLALLLTRVAERATGLPWRNINRQLGRIAQVTLAGPAGTVVQTTPLKPEQKAIYQALSIQPPPRVTTFDPT